MSCSRSESPSQVLLIVLQWLLALMKGATLKDGELPPVTLAYDNMCNLDRLRVATKPLPFQPPFDKVWLNVTKIIDVFHFNNHVDPLCRERYSPAKLKADNPGFNTQVGEQTFSWLCRFKHIVCAMNKTHHLFYIHRMVLRRNAYTSKCYAVGRKPVLPKSVG